MSETSIGGGTVAEHGNATGATGKEGGCPPSNDGTGAGCTDMAVATGSESLTAAAVGNGNSGCATTHGDLQAAAGPVDMSNGAVGGEANTSGGQKGDACPSLEACILPLKKYMKQGHFVKYLEDLGITVVTARKQRGWGYAFVYFASLVDRARAEKIISQQTAENGRPMCLRNAINSHAKDSQAKPDNSNRTMDIRDAVSPLWRVPYGEQLLKKFNKVSHALALIRKKVVQNCLRQGRRLAFPMWVEATRGPGSPPCCPLIGILRSPQVTGYRNKCEFTIGPGIDGQPVVGFCLGAYKDGVTAVAPSEDCPHISAIAVRYAGLLQAFLRSRSRLPIWDKRLNRGFWRLLVVREGRRHTFLPRPDAADNPDLASTVTSFADIDWRHWLVAFPPNPSSSDVPHVEARSPAAPAPDEVMLVLQIDPSAAEQGAADQELAAAAAFLQAAASQEALPLSSLMLQLHTGISNAAPADAPLLPVPAAPGHLANLSGRIRDTLAGLRFNISPAAFFQVNSAAAAVMYKLVGEWAGCERDTLVLDVCCGTGTIGISVSGQVSQVVGVDIVEQAIEDARQNVAENGVKNADFIAAKAEDIMPKLLSRQGLAEVLAAARAGQAWSPEHVAADAKASRADEPEGGPRKRPRPSGAPVPRVPGEGGCVETEAQPSRIGPAEADATAAGRKPDQATVVGTDAVPPAGPERAKPPEPVHGTCPAVSLSQPPESHQAAAPGLAGAGCSEPGRPTRIETDPEVPLAGDGGILERPLVQTSQPRPAGSGSGNEVLREVLERAAGSPEGAAEGPLAHGRSGQIPRDAIGLSTVGCGAGNGRAGNDAEPMTEACLGKRKREPASGEDGRAASSHDSLMEEQPADEEGGGRQSNGDVICTGGGDGADASDLPAHETESERRVFGKSASEVLPEKLVAVVDPPRAGLHPKVLMAMLKCASLKRVVYVSCNPDALVSNVETLCMPCQHPDYIPFVPVRAIAVDLFPHTNHCEAVLLLER